MQKSAKTGTIPKKQENIQNAFSQDIINRI